MKYCTYLTIYKGNLLPPFYIGSTSLKRIECGYRGSVTSKRYKQIWRDEQFYNPHLFTVTVLSLHSTREEASVKEVKIQKLLNVVNNPLYTNLGIHYNNHVLYSKVRSKEHNLKISKSLKGIKRDDEFKRKVSINHSRRGPVTQTTRDKMSRSRTGYITSQDTKLKISNARRGKQISQAGYDKMIIKRMNGQMWKITTPSNETIYTNNLLTWCKNQFSDKAKSARSAMSTKSGWSGYFAVRE